MPVAALAGKWKNYRNEIRKLLKNRLLKNKKISVRFGAEVDYSPEFEKEIKKFRKNDHKKVICKIAQIKVLLFKIYSVDIDYIVGYLRMS